MGVFATEMTVCFLKLTWIVSETSDYGPVTQDLLLMFDIFLKLVKHIVI
jgi:hypothetical protein